MKYAELRYIAFLFFTIIVFVSAYFVGNFAPVVNHTDAEMIYADDVATMSGVGNVVFNLSLKEGINNCLVNVSKNVTQDNQSGDVIVRVSDKNDIGGMRINALGVSDYKGGFDVLSEGKDIPVGFEVAVNSVIAPWEVICIQQPASTILFN